MRRSRGVQGTSNSGVRVMYRQHHSDGTNVNYNMKIRSGFQNEKCYYKRWQALGPHSTLKPHGSLQCERTAEAGYFIMSKLTCGSVGPVLLKCEPIHMRWFRQWRSGSPVEGDTD